MFSNFFGNLTSGLIRLETTEKVTAGSGSSVQQALKSVNQAFGEVSARMAM